jgi:hypothetical protein
MFQDAIAFDGFIGEDIGLLIEMSQQFIEGHYQHFDPIPAAALKGSIIHADRQRIQLAGQSLYGVDGFIKEEEIE